jgi:hypothetical protein
MNQFTKITDTVTLRALRTSDATPWNVANEVFEFSQQHDVTVELHYKGRIFRVKPVDTVDSIEDMLISWVGGQ